MIRSKAILLILFIASLQGHAQQETVNRLVQKLQDYRQNTIQEKIFVHLDRTFYVGGETMWLKIYVMDGYFHHALDLSKVVYVDVLDRNQRPVIQTKVSMDHGRGNGSIIIPASLDSDNYTVRAYTNWMKNFNPDFYFHQSISMVNAFQRLEEKNKDPDHRIDTQFFPEGGQLVDGIKSKVAFRVIDSSGKGISFTGSLLSKQGDTLLTFQPLKFGMGHFLFTPNATEDYRVVIKEKNGRLTRVQLPAIQSTGYVLTVTDTSQHQIKVTITGKEVNASSLVYLIGHNRQIVKTATALPLTNGKSSLLLNKKELGEGIVHLTLFNQNQQPVGQRLYFNRPTETIPLQLSTDKTDYEPRNKITLKVNLPGTQTQGINTSLSVYKMDSLQQINPTTIQSYLWLTSELKGTIESPEYYFSRNADVEKAIDHLMLTHGWSRFKWNEVLQSHPKTLQFIPEYRGHMVNGKITDINSSQPAVGVLAYLGTPDKKVHPYFARSDSAGHLLFETTNMIGNRKLIVQTGSHENNTRIEIESPFSSNVSDLKTPYLRLSDHVKESLTQRSISMQVEDIYYRGRARTKFQLADSSAFYGNASEHYLLDDYTRFPLIEEVMREYVKGVRIRKKEDKTILSVLDVRRNSFFENNPLILLDGVAVFNMDKIMDMDPLKIKSIDVMTSRYYLGLFSFDGIISLKTYPADLGGLQFDPGTIILDYQGLLESKEFYAPRYETPTDRQSRLPDQRNLLLWMPDVTLQSGNQTIEFYSSDQHGVFQAVIQGITPNGQPVYQTHVFEVKSRPN